MNEADSLARRSREIAPGYRAVTVRLPRCSALLSTRSLVVCAALVVAIVGLGLVSFGLGSYQVPLGDVMGALAGAADEQVRMLVLEWRMPRALIAVVSGIALALSGAVFQSLTRNPLGSPDVIGFTSGSYSGAIIVMHAFGSYRYLDIAAGAIIGGAITALVVYLLATRHGSVQSFRLIIMGIGVTALLSSINSMLMLSVSVDSAMLAAVWAAGSFNALGNDQLWPLASIVLALVVAVSMLAPSLRQLELGDDAARSLGVRADRARAALVLVAVSLTAVVTAAAGPISFVALAAPQIARRLVRGTGPVLVPAALVGAFTLLASDVLAQRAGLPVGVVTVSLGGAYLTWLLITEFRRRP